MARRLPQLYEKIRGERSKIKLDSMLLQPESKEHRPFQGTFQDQESRKTKGMVLDDGESQCQPRQRSAIHFQEQVGVHEIPLCQAAEEVDTWKAPNS